jgi:D-alanyl-D-alanine carboxypeptidase
MAALRTRTQKRPTARGLLLGLASLGTCALALLPNAAHAQIGSYRYSSIIVDDASGKVTEAANADAPRYPASLTKLMTLYMTFEAIRDHKITLNQTVPVSAHAASMEPTKLGLVPGTHITVEDAILGAVTKSANDAACALGELVGGSEERFAQLMTLRARALGMTHTTWRNASGLPDPGQVTTARDLALLAHHLIQDFPEQYHYFSVPSFVFHGHTIPNHDRMLQDYDGADGLKTGYTVAAGHNLVTSAKRGGVRLIGVVMGAASNPERDLHMASLLDSGFGDMGVPVEPRAPRHFHLPSLMASAEASTLHGRSATMHLRGHLVHGRWVHNNARPVVVAAVAAKPAAPHAKRHTHAVASGACKGHGHRHGCLYASRDTRGT